MEIIETLSKVALACVVIALGRLVCKVWTFTSTLKKEESK